MIHLYSYKYEIPVSANHYDGLENTTMFNDKLKLYKNFKNVINFKIRDRDRKTIIVSNDLTVKLVFINEYTGLIVSTLYLSVQNTGTATSYQVEILPSDLVNFEQGISYSFIASLMDANGQDEALYIDHDFNVKGKVQILESYASILEDTMKDYSQRYTNAPQQTSGVDAYTPSNPIPDNYYFNDFVQVDDNFVELDFSSYDNSSTCDVIVQIQSGKYYPLYTNENVQWKDVVTYHGIGDTTFNLNLNKFGYYRIVMVTPNPEKFYMVRKYTNHNPKY